MADRIATVDGELYGLDVESRQMVLDTVEQVHKRLLTKEAILEFDRKEIFPEKVIREMLSPEVGLQLLFIPEEYGGMGGGARDCCQVTQAMSGICLGIATAFFAIQLGTEPLIVGATSAQKEKWLTAIAEGDVLVAYAVTEPEAGSNVAALKTKAEPISDDDGNVTAYKINGSKQFISNGGYADLFTVLAKTPEGPSFFVLEKGMKGFERGKGEEKHGIRASNTSPLTMTDVIVPIENLIGGVPGKGLKQANRVFGYTRLMVASMALGAADAALNIAVGYAKERIQFGEPLSDKQGYTHKLIVPNAVRIEAASAYIEEIAVRLDAGDEDLQVEGAIGKLFATEAANRLADDAMQALGGYGYICEFEVEKIKRDVKITCIYEGTSEIQQSIISTFRWKVTRKSKGDFYRELADQMMAISQNVGNVGARFYALAAHALNETITLIHENRLTRLQTVMFMLADMATWVEVGAALVKKSAQMLTEKRPGSEKVRLASRIFACETAQLMTDNLLKILLGTGQFDQKTVSDFLEKVAYHEMLDRYKNLISDMDQLADIIFGR